MTEPDPVFFLHVMKTGGTTLFNEIRRNYENDEVYPHRQDLHFDGPRLDIHHHLSLEYLEALAPRRRSRIRVYTGHFPYVALELLGGDFRTVTILRDPVERTISLLHQFRRPAPWTTTGAPAPLRSMELHDVYAHPRVFAPLIHNHQTKMFSMVADDRPAAFLDEVPMDADRLEIAKQNLAKIDVIGLMERYDDFVDELVESFGWKIRRETRLNAAPEAAPNEVDPSLRERIVEDNALDIELYQYAQALVRARSRTETAS